jgi:hypothetical protein
MALDILPRSGSWCKFGHWKAQPTFNISWSNPIHSSYLIQEEMQHLPQIHLTYWKTDEETFWQQPSILLIFTLPSHRQQVNTDEQPPHR